MIEKLGPRKYRITNGGFTTRTGEIGLDVTVLVFTLAVSLAMALLFAWVVPDLLRARGVTDEERVAREQRPRLGAAVGVDRPLVYFRHVLGPTRGNSATCRRMHAAPTVP